MNSNFAMMVVSCDSYTEVAYTFFKLTEKFMPWMNNIYFVNETLPLKVNNVKEIHTGKDLNWSDKVRKALNQIKEEYILFMLEDFFIGKSVSEKTILEAISFMEKENIKYYKITAIPKSKRKSKYASYLKSIPSNQRYGINLQAAIFRKDFLLEIVSGENRNAWQTETDLLKKVTKKYEYNLEGCVLDNRNIIDIHNGVIKGKWVPTTIKYFKKIGIDIPLGNRSLMSKWELFKMNFKRFISHLLPQGLVKLIKRLFKKLGFKFVSDN